MAGVGSPPPTDLVEALRWSVARYPGRHLTLLDRRGRAAARAPLEELVGRAEEAASRLARAGIGPGTPAIVALPTSLAWLDAWLGVLFAGGLPVAISPAGQAEDTARRVSSLLRRLGGRHLLCTPSLRRRLATRDSLPPTLVALTPDELAALAPARYRRTAPESGDEVAFYQLTSGTTDESRVVMIRHRGVIHNSRAIGAAVAASLGRDDATGAEIVSWLPLYHDMGLVGTLLCAFLVGLDITLMPPEAFLGRPDTWLTQLDRGRPTATTAPNFGYQFCLECLDESRLRALDLSAWQAALVGAEMVRPETLDAFGERFATWGFEAGAFRPCYGLAEGCLAVTLDRVGGYRTAPVPADGPTGGGGEVVCLGAPIDDTEVWAAAADGAPLPEGRVGEIKVRGPGVFAGYLNDSEATAAALDGDVLSTGDLGFVRAGELYLTGRIKEILLVRGQNLMPHDLETLAEREIGGGRCRAACFTVDRGAEGEQIVLVAEAPTRETGELARIEQAIRRGIGTALGLPIADLAFVPAGKLPRTTSGKVPRSRLREDYLAGRVERLDY